MMIDTEILLAWGATYKKLVADETIFQEGIEANFYYQLEEGIVHCVNTLEDGREFIQHVVEPGECFGQVALFDARPYAVSAISVSTARILRLNKLSFQLLLREYPEIHFRFSQNLAEFIRFKLLLAKEMAGACPEQMIRTLLTYFKRNKRQNCVSCDKVHLTRQQIADMLGLRVETVIRTVRLLHKKGLIDLDKGKIYFRELCSEISEFAA